MLKYILLWFPMIILAVANGAARELWYKKVLGERKAHQVSTITLIILFAIYIWFVINKFPPLSASQAIMIGLLWLILTLLFEFGFGFYRGKTITELLSNYNIFKGRIWVLIPLWLTMAPYIFYKLKLAS